MKKTLLTLIVVSVLMLSLQSFKSPLPVNHSVKKVSSTWLPGYNGRIDRGYQTIYINASYPGTITDMVIENSDGSLTAVVSWTSPTVSNGSGGFTYTGRIYYVNSSDELVFMAMSKNIELALIE